MDRSVGSPRTRSVVGVRGPGVSVFGLPHTMYACAGLILLFGGLLTVTIFGFFLHYTRFQCYMYKRHLRSSFDMPSFDMLFKQLFNC